MIITDIEAASNMRLLTVISENPEDNNIIPLTPCHLIIGDAIRPLPSEIYSHEEKGKKLTKYLKERGKEKKQKLLRKKRHEKGSCCSRSLRSKEQTRMANKNSE